MSKRVLAIVVSYNPDLSVLSRALEALVTEDCKVLLVDNASTNSNEIKQLCNSLHGVAFKGLPENLGLGTAHNIGIHHARDNAFDYVLILDQDSIPMDGMVEQLLIAHQSKSRQHRVSAVGVTYLNADNGAESFFVQFGLLKFKRQYCGQRDDDACVPADFLISSGSLISCAALAEIGEMDETLFIDHIDTEWFLRARAKGYQAYGVCEARMQHGLGENTHRVSLGGRQRNVPQHKPFRYYYIFRNSVLLYRRAYMSKLWKWNDVQRLGMIGIMFGMLKSPRAKNLSMMVRGIRDGLRGVTGPMSDE